MYTPQALKVPPGIQRIRPRRSDARNSLYVRLHGLGRRRLHVGCSRPRQRQDWRSAPDPHDRAPALPHVRNYVHVSRALAGCPRPGGVPQLPARPRPGIGVIHLDWRGRLLEANDSARDLLRQGNGLTEEGGFLSAHWPDDDARPRSPGGGGPAGGQCPGGGRLHAGPAPLRGRAGWCCTSIP